MPDIGRWNGIDQLSESYISASPYAYVLNNPINMFDPDGRATEPWQAMWDATPDGKILIGLIIAMEDLQAMTVVPKVELAEEEVLLQALR